MFFKLSNTIVYSLYCSDAQSVLSEIAVGTAPENMIQMQIPGHYPRPTESETLVVTGYICALRSLPDSDVHFKCECLYCIGSLYL